MLGLNADYYGLSILVCGDMIYQNEISYFLYLTKYFLQEIKT